jgi:hypothetical protein
MEFQTDNDEKSSDMHGLFGTPMCEYDDERGEPHTSRGIFALMKFFDISTDDVGPLFQNRGYHHRTGNGLPIRPLDVAIKIEEYIYSRETNQP